MRRTRFILALIAALSVVTVGARPAAAHFCSFPVKIAVNKDVTVNIGVAAEALPVRDVDIEIPAGFTLKESFGYLGYVGETRGKWVHFTGAEIAPYTCHYFALAGRATRKGEYIARIITTAADGTKTTYKDPNPATQYPAMLIFAGVPIPTDFTPDSGGGVPMWLGVVGAFGAGALAVGIAVLVRRRVTMKG